MESFEFTTEPRSLAWWKGAVISGSLWFLGMMAWTSFGPTAMERQESFWELAAGLAIPSALFGSLMGFTMRRKILGPRMRTVLSVDGDGIAADYDCTFPKKRVRSRISVQRNGVGTIFKIKGDKFRPGGIGVSERRFELVARMGGFVYLPETMPDYERVRMLVESWRVAG